MSSPGGEHGEGGAMTQQNSPTKCPTCHDDKLKPLDAGLYRTGWIAQGGKCPDPWHREPAAPPVMSTSADEINCTCSEPRYGGVDPNCEYHYPDKRSAPPARLENFCDTCEASPCMCEKPCTNATTAEPSTKPSDSSPVVTTGTTSATNASEPSTQNQPSRSSAAPPAGMTAAEFMDSDKGDWNAYRPLELNEAPRTFALKFAEAFSANENAHLRGEVERLTLREQESLAAFSRLAGFLGNPTLDAGPDSSLEMELVKLAEAELARVRRAALRFYANRGQHEGDHDSLDHSCSKCTTAYVIAEAEFDTAFGLHGTPVEARAALESTTPQTEAVMNSLWFHGTTSENAIEIEKIGFREGTWFARHMEDAIKFGGPVVFVVKVKFDSTPMGWQTCSANVLGPETIQKKIIMGAISPQEENK